MPTSLFKSPGHVLAQSKRLDSDCQRGAPGIQPTFQLRMVVTPLHGSATAANQMLPAVQNGTPTASQRNCMKGEAFLNRSAIRSRKSLLVISASLRLHEAMKSLRFKSSIHG